MENTIFFLLKSFKKLQFENDLCHIKEYLDVIFSKNDAENRSKIEISPFKFNLLINCPSASIAVERSFSMLSKLLTEDRNFSDENVLNYFKTKMF